MEEIGRQAETSLSKFSYALDQLEHTLRPVLKAIDELRATGNEDDLDPMSRARMHISMSYAINALFCMYLRTQGVDPATHPVSDDIARVQDAFMRMRKVEAGISADHQPAPDRDRRRHIVNAKKSAQALSSLVFPEEVDLLNAIRGKKRKRETPEHNKPKKIRTEETPSMSPKGSALESSDEGENNTSEEDRRNEGNAVQSGRGNVELVDNTQSEHTTKNHGTSQVRDSTDSSSEEEHRAQKRKAGAKQRREKLGSAENVSEKKKKKKTKSKDSSLDSEKKISRDKKNKDKKERTTKGSKLSEEKRKRKKRKQEKRPSRQND